MKRIAFLVLAAGALALGLACTETTEIVQPGEDSVPSVSVSGSGSVFGEPDVAVVTLGVEAEAATVGEARDEAAAAMDAVIGALRDGGVAEEDIQTTRFSVQPRFGTGDERDRIVAFTVTNIVTAKIRDVDETGALIDAAVEAGGDLSRVQGVSFTIDDPSALEDEARRMAVEEARSKAETLADAAGVELGDARTIVESGGPVPVDFAAEGAFQVEEDIATRIETGELEVRVDVQVVYEIR